MQPRTTGGGIIIQDDETWKESGAERYLLILEDVFRCSSNLGQMDMLAIIVDSMTKGNMTVKSKVDILTRLGVNDKTIVDILSHKCVLVVNGRSGVDVVCGERT